MTRLERVGNEQIKIGMCTEKIMLDFIAENRLIWYGHLRLSDRKNGSIG